MEKTVPAKEHLLIDKPAEFSNQIIKQVQELIQEGGQIKPELIKVGLHRAALLAVILKGDLVISVCCLKTPLSSYRDSVFKDAGVPEMKDDYNAELGYVVTHSDYEGLKLCQQLLTAMFPHLNDKAIFASTRKPAMIHILGKFGFKPVGKVYKQDLSLLIRQGI
ncbi:hypothetical protein DIU31_022695 [Mucilaginibacter rubeus]|uniref:N-acetyltransferase domain-containing protein n=2 Tax=Mucilaginibacter rubeus TaxID=2027860 RepID=A0A364WQG1_9SPHI|nr:MULTISPECIES: hypothetical protein [Mucilaginibacter]QEM06187.1 hypothetical protein DIU31_022695 [Mucilaginibacter rubeus]QEM13704.1 hypothetical protein DEO27_028050 [Mucilaginibacter rubeus]QEM18770.1 hypothetical protein DIU38_022935 [Mucilaginibacter gossypii]QTE36236.1 hypothetical protein J3L18_24365 [Mucilaginibacter gossypii]QTE44689.1 hypothetical protein J3L19_04790 [Mucilaginibacter rubeus]